MNNIKSLKDSIFKVGKVISVDGRLVRVKVDKSKNSSHLLYNGELLKNVSVGGYLKIIKGFTKIIGKVKGEYVAEDKFASQKDYLSDKDKINRTLEIELLGFFSNSTFKRGIKEMPLIDNECFLLENDEFNQVHDFVDRNDEPLSIGTLTMEKGQPISIGINNLFASHFGIFGNTGSGKSYTLAKLYSELFNKYKQSKSFKENAHFILFDFNGEYSGDECITNEKKIYNLSTKASDSDKFPIAENDLVDIELLSILASATEKTQKPFLSRALSFYRTVHKSHNPDDHLAYFQNILRNRIKDILKMADKQKAFALLDLLSQILTDEENSYLETTPIDDLDWQNKYQYFKNKDESQPLNENDIESTDLYKSIAKYTLPTNIITRIIHFLYLQLIHDLYRDKVQNEHIAPVINKLKSKQKDIEKVLDTNIDSVEVFKEYNFVIVNLYDVNLDMKKTLPLLLSKKLYSDHKNKRKKDFKESLNIIIDEAHNILSKESVREAESWKDYRLETFEEIIKEGRKFGVFLSIASQRPSDISPTIISQLHNYFLHRLINNNDILAIERTISYLDKLSVESLSILPTGSCILAGIFAQIPVIVDIGRIDPNECEPNSKTPELIRNWSD